MANSNRSDNSNQGQRQQGGNLDTDSSRSNRQQEQAGSQGNRQQGGGSQGSQVSDRDSSRNQHGGSGQGRKST
jgi:hypothetical protein